MSSLGAHSPLLELLSCSICTEPYTLTGSHIPFHLACTHTFCLLCIQRMHINTTIRCPSCRESTHIPTHARCETALRRNLTMIELMTQQQQQEQKQHNTNLPVVISEDVARLRRQLDFVRGHLHTVTEEHETASAMMSDTFAALEKPLQRQLAELKQHHQEQKQRLTNNYHQITEKLKQHQSLLEEAERSCNLKSVPTVKVSIRHITWNANTKMIEEGAITLTPIPAEAASASTSAAKPQQPQQAVSSVRLPVPISHNHAVVDDSCQFLPNRCPPGIELSNNNQTAVKTGDYGWDTNLVCSLPRAENNRCYQYQIRVRAPEQHAMVGWSFNNLDPTQEVACETNGWYLFLKTGQLFSQDGVEYKPFHPNRIQANQIITCIYDAAENTIAFQIGKYEARVAFEHVLRGPRRGNNKLVPCVLLAVHGSRAELL